MGAALLRQRAGGEGGERRGPPAGRQHRQRHGVGDLPRVPRLLPPHRHPGPDGRDGELPGLLPGAVGARHLITDEQSALGARGSSRGTARTALRPRQEEAATVWRAAQMRSDSSEVMARIGLS